jgi:hypothetical protein
MAKKPLETAAATATLATYPRDLWDRAILFFKARR